MSVTLTRRQAFKAMLCVGCTVADAALPKSAVAEQHPEYPEPTADMVAMLYDSTVCTGCKACMPACNEANGLPPDTLHSGGIWDMPTSLNSKTKNIIQLFQEPESDQFAFVKEAVHALPRSGVRNGMPFRLAEEGRPGCGDVESLAVHRLPVLRGGVPL